MDWKDYKKKVFDLIKEDYPQAIYLGDSNSYQSDIQIDDYFIDIKMPHSQCGQSTDESQFIEMQTEPRKWVQQYYTKKNVKYWAVCLNNKYILTDPADNNWSITPQPVRNKRSGSRPLAKKWVELAAVTIGTVIEESNKRYFVKGNYKNKQLFETPEITFLLSECGNQYFEVRIRGNTNNPTQVMSATYQGTYFRFIDLFAGIGGWRIPAEQLGGECVFTAEIDKIALQTYNHNFKTNVQSCDITTLDETMIPEFDVLFASFPCQAFSISGKQLGFEDTRGTLVFDVLRIAKYHKPPIIFMENVDNFATHDNGKTWITTKRAFEDIGYTIVGKKMKSSEYGSPQERKRFYMIAMLSDIPQFPEKSDMQVCLEDLLTESPQTVVVRDDFQLAPAIRGTRVAIVGKGGQGERIYSTEVAMTLTAQGGGQFAKTGGYLTSDGPRALTVKEAATVMGFPAWYEFPVSNSQALKQLGNSVSIDVVLQILLSNINIIGKRRK